MFYSDKHLHHIFLTVSENEETSINRVDEPVKQLTHRTYYCKNSFTNDLNDQCFTKKLPDLIYFALTNIYFNNVFMSTTVLLGLTSFDKKLGASEFVGGGPVTFQIYWPPGPVAPGA